MKKLISFLLCAVIGLLFTSVVTFGSSTRGKPDFDLQTATVQPFQEQAEHEKDVGSIEYYFINQLNQKATESPHKRTVFERTKPNIVFRN